MTQERLTSLALFHIHYDKEINLDRVAPNRANVSENELIQEPARPDSTQITRTQS